MLLHSIKMLPSYLTCCQIATSMPLCNYTQEWHEWLTSNSWGLIFNPSTMVGFKFQVLPWMERCCIHSTLNCIQGHTVHTSWQWRVSNPRTPSPLSAITSLPKAIYSSIKTVPYLQYTSLWQSYPLHISLDISHQYQQR